jgi:hypothetical protein
MAQPERNPFESPRSDLGSERVAPQPFRWRMLGVALSVQLTASLLVLAALTLDEVGPAWILVALVFQVAPSAAAYWALLRKKRTALMLSLISGLLLSGLMGASAAPGKIYLQLLAFTILGLTLSLMWSQGAFRRNRPG